MHSITGPDMDTTETTDPNKAVKSIRLAKSLDTVIVLMKLLASVII
jgi:hypothetical protein